MQVNNIINLGWGLEEHFTKKSGSTSNIYLLHQFGLLCNNNPSTNALK